MKPTVKKMPIKIKAAIAITMAVLIGMISILIQHDEIDTTYYKIYSPKISEGIKTVHLTDLHAHEFGENNEALIDKVKALSPDVIFITGDMLNYKDSDYSVTTNLCTNLVEIAPVYYSFGNHEYNQFLFEDQGLKDILQKTGVHLLNDRMETALINGNTVSICGLSQNVEQYDKYGTDLIAEFEQTDGLRILLDHYPEHYYEKLVSKDIDVTFSGHAHGGHIRLPGGQGIYAPDQGLFPDLTEGVHIFGNTNLVISRGLGDHTIIPRINNHPEIVVTYLAPSNGNR